MKERLIKVIDKLIHDTAIAELAHAYKTRETSNLSYHDTLYLNIIEAHPNRYTSSQIADLLKITRPAVTQKINELCKKGYIIRTQSEKDKRVYYLSTNPKNSFYSEEDKHVENKAVKMLRVKYGDKKVNRMCDMLEFLSETIYNEKMREAEDDK